MTVAVSRSSQRGRRGRVMLVGDGPDSARVASLLAQPPLRVANMFEAIGEVTASGAAEPVIAVIVDEDLLRGVHQHAAEALRKIDPSVRIVGVSASAAAPTVDGRGVDAWMSASAMRPDDLRRALDDDALVSTTPIAPPAGIVDLDDMLAPEPQAQSRLPGPQGPTPPQGATPIVPIRPDATPPVTAAPPAASPENPSTSAAARPTVAPARPVASPAVAPPRIASVPLPPAAAIGDTDLINALLHDPAGVVPTALRIIAYHTNWNDARVIEAAADYATSPAVHAAEITRGSQRFGRLAASGASALELRVWADWLAHWMAIEHSHRLRATESLTDDLTTAGNRRFFERFLRDAIAAARRDRRPLSVLVFDIYNFKTYNDQFGHAAGDEILREIVRMLKSVIRQGDAVCRIGGDEFVVVFADSAPPRAPGSKPPENVQEIAQRFQAQVCSMRFPKLGVEALGTLSISAGLATYPWDGNDPDSLLRHADELALESKRKGKNALTLGRGAATACEPDHAP